jgi:hypothetical protein
MHCWNVRRRVSAYLDNAVAEEERREMRQHMQDCGACAREPERYQRIREALRSLPRRTPPPELALRLRVAASKAQARKSSGASPWARWCNRAQLALSNLMRPLALPLAGGLCSAVCLFSALVPTFNSTFAANKSPSPWDVPTMLNTEAMVKCVAPVAFGDADALVEVSIDDQGRVVGYTIVRPTGKPSPDLRRRIENQLPFLEFWPATAFGKPISGTITVSFGSSHIEVKG